MKSGWLNHGITYGKNDVSTEEHPSHSGIGEDELGIVCGGCSNLFSIRELSLYRGRLVCPLCDYPIEEEEHDEDY